MPAYTFAAAAAATLVLWDAFGVAFVDCDLSAAQVG